MRQISPDKKRTYVYSKRKGVFLPGRSLQKNNVHSPGKLTGNCGRFVYKIICDA